MAMDHINGHFCWTCGPGPLLKNPPKGPLWVWVWESCCGVCLAVVAMGSRNHLRVQLAWWCGEGAVLPTLHCPLSCVVYLFILLLSYSQWALPAVNRPCSVQTESCKKMGFHGLWPWKAYLPKSGGSVTSYATVQGLWLTSRHRAAPQVPTAAWPCGVADRTLLCTCCTLYRGQLPRQNIHCHIIFLTTK